MKRYLCINPGILYVVNKYGAGEYSTDLVKNQVYEGTEIFTDETGDELIFIPEKNWSYLAQRFVEISDTSIEELIKEKELILN